MIWTYLQISLSILRLCITYWSLTPLYTVCPHGTTTEKPNILKINQVGGLIYLQVWYPWVNKCFSLNFCIPPLDLVIRRFEQLADCMRVTSTWSSSSLWEPTMIFMKEALTNHTPWYTKNWCCPKKPVEVNNTRNLLKILHNNLKKLLKFYFTYRAVISIWFLSGLGLDDSVFIMGWIQRQMAEGVSLAYNKINILIYW